MAVDLERLVVQLSADVKQYNNALNKAMGLTNKQARSIETRFQKMNKGVSTSFVGLGRTLVGVFAGAVSVRGAQQLIDAATRIENALKVAGLSGDELARVYDRLFASAQKNAAPLESLVTLYGRAAIVQKELGVSTEELLGFTNNVALALRVAGTDAQSASGAVLQLSQALGSGVVRAEEFNSILEGALPIAQAAAAGLEEAGGSVAALRQLVVDGKISSEAFFRAFEAGSVILDEKVAGSELTVSQAFVRLQNVLIDTAGKFDDSVDASGNLARFMENTLVPAIQELGGVFSWLSTGPVAEFIGYINAATEAVLQLSADIGAATGLDEIGRSLGAKPFVGQKRIQDRIDSAFAGLADQKDNRQPTEITATKPNAVVRPVSIEDYAAPTKTGKGRGRGGRGSQNELQREIEQIKERTAAIQAETGAMAGLNPLINDYGFVLEKARATQDLLTAAQKAGVAVTPELKAKIDELATGYANASVEAERLAESQDKARQTAEDMRDLGKDVLGGFIKDLRDGKSASEALANALGKVADKLLDMALNSMFSGGGLFGGGGGLFGGAIIPGILHSGGVAGRDGYGHGRAVSPSVFAGARRYHKGGIAGLQPGEVPAILQRGEVVIPKGGVRATGGQSIVINAPINAPGADAAALARVERSVQELGKNIPKMVDRRTDARQTRRTRA